MRELRKAAIVSETGITDIPGAAQLGRRDRNMREKRERITRAAAELFAELGFAAVTTQAISDRADVAAGTLFRYASSKSELLLMVYNEVFREAMERGIRLAGAETSAASAVASLVREVVEQAQRSPENSVAYQRELLFGAYGEHFRAEGLELVASFESEIAQMIGAEAARRGIAADPDSVRVAGASVFAAMHLAIARLSTGAHEGTNVYDDLRLQIAQIVEGTLRGLHEAHSPARGVGTPRGKEEQ